jgi:hypothetical protein
MFLEQHENEFYTVCDRATDKLKELRAEGDRVFTDKEVMSKFRSLAKKLPTEGRIGYNSKNMEPFRKEIDLLSNLVMQLNSEVAKAHKDTLLEISNRDQSAMRIAKEVTVDSANKKISMERKQERFEDLLADDGEDKTKFAKSLRDDYMARLGQHIIGVALDMNKQFRKEDWETKNNKQKRIEARRFRKRSTQVFNKFVYTLGTIQRGIQTDFTKEFDEVKYEMEQEQWRAAQ